MANPFHKEDCLTIPNLLSILRILLIPLILWLYCEKQRYLTAAAVIGISGLTDILDGAIARGLHQVTELGKVLDPLADKLTQLATMACLLTRFPVLLGLMLLFLAKELSCIAFGSMVVRKVGKVSSAMWFGKVNTVVLWCLLMVLILFPELDPGIVSVLAGISAAVMALTCALYLRYDLCVLHGGEDA